MVPSTAESRRPLYRRWPLFGEEVGGIWRWAGVAGFLGILSGAGLSTPSLSWPQLPLYVSLMNKR